jgi:hypothetical protein
MINGGSDPAERVLLGRLLEQPTQQRPVGVI